MTEFMTLRPEDGLELAADLMRRTPQRDFPVESGGGVVGVLLKEDVQRMSPDERAVLSVAAAMRPEIEAVRPSDALEPAFRRLLSGSLAALAVLDGPRLVGLLTRDNVREYLLLHQVGPRPSMAG